MQTYAVASTTNYGLMVQIVNAQSPDEALKIAKDNGAWDWADVVELNTATPGIIKTFEPTG